MVESRAALVLAGGGALGAYEAGALCYVLDGLAREHGVKPRLSIFAGTSVGALNACFVAARAADLAKAARELRAYWESVTLAKGLSFGPRQLVNVARLLAGPKPSRSALLQVHKRDRGVGHRPVAGIFNTDKLTDAIDQHIPWPQLQRNLDNGTVQGVALCATEVCTGRSIIFYQAGHDCAYAPGRDPAKQARPVRIGLQHALASAAMPFLFPSVQIDGVCYTDGGLRQNTPLNPALRMGADRLLVISVTQPPAVASRVARIGCRRNPYPGLVFLLGKIFNALLAPSLDYELGRIETYNELIRGGTAIYGDDFVTNLNRIMGPSRNAHFRPVRACHIRPSRDLNEVARRSLAAAPEELTLPGAAGRIAARFMRSTAFVESDLLALLLFTPTFTRALLELGYGDARKQAEELKRCLCEPGEMAVRPTTQAAH